MTKLDELNRLIDENNKSIKRLAKIVATPVYARQNAFKVGYKIQ